MALTIETIISLCKRRGFVFQSSEIYGGLASTYDYGPLGAVLKRNIKDAWWRAMWTNAHDIEGWTPRPHAPGCGKASRHVENFQTPPPWIARRAATVSQPTDRRSLSLIGPERRRIWGEYVPIERGARRTPSRRPSPKEYKEKKSHRPKGCRRNPDGAEGPTSNTHRCPSEAAS
jgi:hypothetical protein